MVIRNTLRYCRPVIFALALLMIGATPFVRSTTASQDENKPPVVAILSPAQGSVVPKNSLVNYAINVSDPEDGESKYDEISAGRIFLEIRFRKGRPAPEDIHRSTDYGHPGLAIVQTSDCFTCHQFNSRMIGPSFSDIARRYKGTGSQALLINRIREGSRSIWGSEVMPPHKDLRTDECEKIVDWILEAGLDQELNYQPGKSGTFRATMPANASEGFFILSATYIDNGVPGEPTSRRTGKDSVVVLCR